MSLWGQGRGREEEAGGKLPECQPSRWGCAVRSRLSLPRPRSPGPQPPPAGVGVSGAGRGEALSPGTGATERGARGGEGGARGPDPRGGDSPGGGAWAGPAPRDVLAETGTAQVITGAAAAMEFPDLGAHCSWPACQRLGEPGGAPAERGC